MKKFAFIALPLILTTACAAVVEGTTQNLNVGTNTNTRGQCTLMDSKNKQYAVSTPGVVEVNRGDGPLSVKCSTDSGEGTKVVRESVEPWTFGNLFIPFLWPLTFAYDGFSGAYQRYPDDVNVNIIALTPSSPTSAPAAGEPFSQPYIGR